jgi:preprotein translocase subunit SecY
MNSFFQRLTFLITDKALRNRLLFVMGALAVFRILAVIPIPGINAAQLELFFANNQFFGLLNLFSGGGLSSLSIVMLGVAPYITASIIMQLLTMMIPALKNLYQEEGEIGRQKFSQYTRQARPRTRIPRGDPSVDIAEQLAGQRCKRPALPTAIIPSPTTQTTPPTN